MNIYQKFNQINKTFEQGEEIIDLIKSKISINTNSFKGIDHLGIQSTPSTMVYVNDKLFEIGKTGILEIQEGTIINSIKFAKRTKAIIDYSYN